MQKKFSKRFGHSTKEKEITIREDAPQDLREYLVQTLYVFGYKPSFLRDTICRVLRKSPDRNNFSEFPNIEGEVYDLVNDCAWFSVYDIIEAFAQGIKAEYRERFHEEINDYFLTNGVGWKLENGQIEFRGDNIFEKTVSNVVDTVETNKLSTAKQEIEEAIRDLSRRPEPDITGAIQHSVACLECVAREAVGNDSPTLGELIKKYRDVVPAPLDQAISKIWGYTSEQGRHLKEGQLTPYLEAQLIVELSAAISAYLAKKISSAANTSDGGLPFE
ncbi:MAG: hypothetical protein EPO24_00335 [Bacteroidetes bacterium]|nr:MAG: hypothetical protein EPO24_00335 [Bacteroidota bacterium]